MTHRSLNLISIICLIGILANCDNNESSDGDTDIVGQYNMTMMDGGSVPDIFTDSAGNQLVLAGGELVIRDDGRFFLQISVVVNDTDESVNVSGSYTQTGSVVMLEGGVTGNYDGADEIDLTYPVAGLQHVFKFDKSSVFEG